MLSDPNLRRQYDSALPFDESIPSASDLDQNDELSFFTVFEPVFVKNARYAYNKPIDIENHFGLLCSSIIYKLIGWMFYCSTVP